MAVSLVSISAVPAVSAVFLGGYHETGLGGAGVGLVDGFVVVRLALLLVQLLDFLDLILQFQLTFAVAHLQPHFPETVAPLNVLVFLDRHIRCVNTI